MSRPPRITGFDYRGPNRYMLTFCTHLRQPLFSDEDVAARTLAQFRRTAVEDQFAIAAYCLMPDHVHLLVEGQADGSDLRRFVRIGKQRSAYEYSRRTGGRRLWQEAYHDRVLRRDDALRAAARYVIENPVRAGIVTMPDQYPHVGSDLWTIQEILAS